MAMKLYVLVSRLKLSVELGFVFPSSNTARRHTAQQKVSKRAGLRMRGSAFLEMTNKFC